MDTTAQRSPSTPTGGQARPAPSRPNRLRALLHGLSTVLIVAGTLLIADAALTVGWQEPVSALLARLSQGHLSHELDGLEQSGPTPLELRGLGALADPRQRIAFLARSLKRRAHPGQAVGRIEIARIGADFVVVDGTGTTELRKGPGLYPQTGFPGTPGTTAIAGHRTTYLAPFRHVDQLRPGDAVTVTMPYARFTYRVQGTRIVAPTDIGVIRRVGYDRLVLSACHPLYSAARRIVVFARLSRVVPAPVALRTG